MNLLQYLVNPKAIKGDLHNLVTSPSRAFQALAVHTSGAHILPPAQYFRSGSANDQAFHVQPLDKPDLIGSATPSINGQPGTLPSVPIHANPLIPISHYIPAQPIRKIQLPGTDNPHWTIFGDHQGNKWYQNDVTGLRLPFKG